MRAVLALALVAPALAGCLAPAAVVGPEAFDPSVPRCVGPCARVIDDSDAQAWEPFLAVNPADPDHIVVAHSEFPMAVDGVETAIGHARVSVTEDGGETWETHVLPSAFAPGPDHALVAYTHEGWQPVLAFLPDGALVMSAFATQYARASDAVVWSSQSLYTLRSLDGGRTWSDARIVDEGQGPAIRGPLFVGAGRSASLAGMAYGEDGTLLLVWSQGAVLHPDNGFGGEVATRLAFSTSEDGGLSWTSPGVVDEASGYGPSPVIGRDGVWRIAYANNQDDELRFAESHDRAATWDKRVIGSANHKTFMQAQTLRSGAERLLLAYTTRAHPDTLQFQTELIWSDDGGATWTPRLVIDAPEGEGAPMPNVVGAGDDSAWVTFHDIEGAGWARHATYRAVKVVGGVAGAPLVLDSMPEMNLHHRALGATPDGDALAAWITDDGGKHDLVWARLTGGDAPAGSSATVVPAGLAEPVAFEFTGHVNVPHCYAAADGGVIPVRSAMTFEFDVPLATRYLNGTLEWPTHGPDEGTTDLDVVFVDAEGDGFDPTDGVPETFAFELREGDQGAWTAEVSNCENPPTDFTLRLLLS